MDFIMPLPKSKGFTGILVVVDRLTKMAHFIAVKKEITALEMAETLMKNVFKLHGLPDKVISDRGPQFTTQVIQEMYKKLDIVPALSTAYHPQTDRQMERVNQDLETYVRLFCMHRQDDWADWLHLAEFSYNNRKHSTIKMSPFRVNNLSDPRWGLETKTEDMVHPAAQDYLKEMKEVETELKACLDMAAEKMKDHYNKGPIPEFLEGEMVFLDARNIKEKIQSKDEPTRSMVQKLRKKRIRPYRILQKIGTLNYRLELLPELLDKGVHDVFHVSLLTRAPDDMIPGRVPPRPLLIAVDSEDKMEVETVLDSRMKGRRLQYLVKWKDLPAVENSWEPAQHLRNAPEKVEEFHDKHPEAPRKISMMAFGKLPWQPLTNYMLPDKKKEISELLCSRDLVP